jgi:hypothetical protein
MPLFYRQIFEAWEKTKVVPGNDPFKLRREILWKNKHIKVKKREIFYEEWHNKGIRMIHDIVDEKGAFKDIKDLSRKHDLKIGVMEYNSLKSAIPILWKKALKDMKIPEQAISNEEQPFLTCRSMLLALSVVQNRDIYWEFISKKMTKPICAMKWCDRYHIKIDDWKEIYILYKEIKDTKIKAFQFKILNNLLPCNLYLSKIGKSETNRCSYCNQLDDIMHYLSNCPATAMLWQQLGRWWSNLTGQQIVLTERDIIIGLDPRRERLEMEYQLNTIILAAKWKVHANKQMGQPTSFYQILLQIRQNIDTLSLIATKNQRMHMHNQLWDKISDFLT